VDAIQFFKPENLIIVGDLFHSRMNKEMDLFLKWRNDLSGLHIQLVKGNHDILTDDWYSKANIEIIQEHLTISGFYFTHDTGIQSSADHYIFSGHIHPGIVIKGPARQALRLPCFYFTNDYAILPAFGKFTGNFPLEVNKKASVYVIMPGNTKGVTGGIIKI
jgi:DNA ligase-associated metallophosphoesterase